MEPFICTNLNGMTKNSILPLHLSSLQNIYITWKDGDHYPITNKDILMPNFICHIGTYGEHDQWCIGPILERNQRRCPSTNHTLQQQSVCYTKKNHQQNSRNCWQSLGGFTQKSTYDSCVQHRRLSTRILENALNIRANCHQNASKETLAWKSTK